MKSSRKSSECGAPALQEIAGGDAVENAAIIRGVLSGEKSARRDVVLLNAAAALVAAGKSGAHRGGDSDRGEVDRFRCGGVRSLRRWFSFSAGCKQRLRPLRTLSYTKDLAFLRVPSCPLCVTPRIFSRYCATCTFHPSSACIKSRSLAGRVGLAMHQISRRRLVAETCAAIAATPGDRRDR